MGDAERSDENELRDMLVTALNHGGPIAFRYPRGRGEGVPHRSPRSLPLGKGEILQDGKDVLILAIGRTVNDALRADASLRQQGIQATVVNCRFVKPLDHELIGDLVRRIPRVITVEENLLEGGFGSAVLECLSNLEITGVTLRRIGIPDTFVEHGSQRILRSKYGIDAPAIVEAARKLSGST